MPKADFKDKQIEKLQAAIAKLEGQSGGAQEAVREKFKAQFSLLEFQQNHRMLEVAEKFQQKIDVLEKQLKALGGK